MNSCLATLRRRSIAAIAVLACNASWSLTAHAQAAWPSRPVTFVVGGAPGGTTDIPTRIVAQKLAARIGQPTVVENKPGTGGTIAAQAVLLAPADGHTIIAGHTGSHATAYAVYKSLPYKPGDFIALTDLVSFTNVLVVNQQSDIKSPADLVAKMKATPDKVFFASAGIGQTTHLTGELLKVITGAGAVHVPYKGSTPATISVVGGETTFMFDNLTQVLPHIKAGKLRALAVTSPQRDPAMPDTPTMKELGYDVNVLGWLGFWVSSKTDPRIAAELAGHLIAHPADGGYPRRPLPGRVRNLRRSRS